MAFVYWIHLPEHTDMFTQGYVGFTSGTVEKRWCGHLADAKRFPHITLYKAVTKYKDSLIVDTILEGGNEYCLEVEFKLRPACKIGWNINAGGERGSLGTKRSEETNRKHSESVSGDKHHAYGKKIPRHIVEKSVAARAANAKPVSAETRAKLSKSNKGLIRSAESRSNVSKGLKGLKKTADHVANMSLSRKLLAIPPWEAGRTNVDVWIQALEIQGLLFQKVSVSEIERRFNFPFRSLMTISRKLKGGWNPEKDLEYLTWLDEYNKTKELHESTQSS